jgi:hypothetical protein
MRRWWFVGVLSSWLLPMAALADRTMVAGQLQPVRLEVNQPTAVCFPEEVASVSVGWDEATLAIKQYGPCLTLQTPYNPLAGRLIVIGKTAQVYSLPFKVQTPADDVVRIVLAAPATEKAVPWTPGALVRGLVTRTPLPGAKASPMPLPQWTDPRLRVLDLRVLHVGGLEGVVLTVLNPQDTPLVLDERLGEEAPPSPEVVHLSSLRFPALYTVLRVQVSSRQLAPGMQAQIILVAKRTDP